jgi:hypothetical protein
MTTRKDDLGREAGPEKTAPIKYSNSACLVMEFDTYEEALAFATRSAAKLSSTTRTARTLARVLRLRSVSVTSAGPGNTGPFDSTN